MDDKRQSLTATQRLVVKIGSALLTNNGQGLDYVALDGWVQQMAQLRQRGIELVLVSSGSVAEGMKRLGWSKRPKALHHLQAAAAIGQMGLVQAYETRFLQYGMQTAQILLTHEDLASRQRYLNARSTLRTLIDLKVVPVINENDTVATEEIRLGDNDTLAALVCNLVEADLLIILTDQQGVFDMDPRLNPQANLVSWSAVSDPQLDKMAGDSHGSLGRGGMMTKIQAARRAARSGCATLIAYGRTPAILIQLLQGAPLGTLLSPDQLPLAAKKQWLAGQLRVKGRLTLDAGAAQSVRKAGKSLLAVGVIEVNGSFVRGDLVACFDPHGKEIARGLINYAAAETRQIMRQPSQRIEELLGYVDEDELIHRDNLILL